MRSRRATGLLAAFLAPLLSAGVPAAAQGEPLCRTVEVEMTPTDDLQIVVWLEDAAGNYVDTMFITRLTGSFGLGNRPGIMEFKSGPLWPYGRRTATFPVWAHRHGFTFPQVVYQNEDDDNLSHPLGQSSVARNYCRPLKESEPMWDAMSCATTAYTDKGRLSQDQTSLYPPRSDLAEYYDPSRDDESVQLMADMNPFDAVSRATPLGGELYTVRWQIPKDLPDGDYVVMAEVAKEFDAIPGGCDPTYCDTDPTPPECCSDGTLASCGMATPSTCDEQGGNDPRGEYICVPVNASEGQCYHAGPQLIPWSEYGVPYRGQPSVLYSVPITVMSGETVGSTADYVGYGDPSGTDGTVRAPDATVSTDVPGSGAARLLLTVDGSDMYRMRARTRIEDDSIAPGAPSELQTVEVTANAVSASFIAPGDDDTVGTAAQYEVRYLAGQELTEDNWDKATLAAVQIEPLEAGTVQQFTLDGLIPRTNYSIGVRAYDNCLNEGALEVVNVTTPTAPAGEVDACFIATAAYGSLMATDVAMLRGFRDVALRGHVPGELLIAGYYTFGPALAKVIAPSDLARSAARSALAPLIERVRRELGH